MTQWLGAYSTPDGAVCIIIPAPNYIKGLLLQGLDEQQAVQRVIELSAPPDAIAPSLIHKDDIPKTRRHRMAWRRSSNGGPIWIDEDLALKIDEAHLWERYEAHGAQRA